MSAAWQPCRNIDLPGRVYLSASSDLSLVRVQGLMPHHNSEHCVVMVGASAGRNSDRFDLGRLKKTSHSEFVKPGQFLNEWSFFLYSMS